ncbi:D-alanine--D-alanine ligase family protein [Leifsonia sp. McL0607]|uniref:D-alanine--D-alanine ligase family protein n=1 Tax=Leifsonia sp. McL0607 TaxID=3415672 RepID=UPI003CEBFCCF
MPEQTIRRVAVIGGGANDEHDISLASAAAVVRAVRALGLTAVPLTIDRRGGWQLEDHEPVLPARAIARLASCDVTFPVLHGVDGEDGAVAGLLRLTGVPFVGSPVRASALGMDKWITKLVAERLGIRTAPGVLVDDRACVERLHLEPPFVVKPTTGGSSNGVSVVREAGQLEAAIETAQSAGGAALVEAFVDGREVDIALFRDRDGELRAGSTLEIAVADGAVFDREQKYGGSAEFTLPARIAADEHAAIDRAARALYDTLGCAGVARFDFFVTADGVVLNEVNTAPGFTEQSQVPRMYAATGLDYPDLVAALLEASVAGVAVAA